MLTLLEQANALAIQHGLDISLTMICINKHILLDNPVRVIPTYVHTNAC